ncbi:MAG: ABC transporter substrate-binding protein [Dehalococcoidia bacterium]|nr:ABC transporter substrate-binding protein [Dehalococcoidia bacterium]
MKKWSVVAFAIVAIAVAAFFALRVNNTPEGTKVIAIANLMSHPILDTVQENLLAELRREGYEDGKNVRIILRNASGQMQVVPSIANELVAQNPDVIIAVTTPVSQAIKKVAKCPVVFGAVTDPIGAGLITSFDRGEEMITGTSDAVPYDEQLRLIRRITPNAKRLGVLFNPGEAASQYGIKQLRKYAPEIGFTLVEGPVSSTGDVYPVAQELSSKVDAILISTDNTVAAGIAAAVKVAVEYKIPLYACDSGSIEKGALAAVSAGYAQVGIDTGKLAVRVLKGERGIPAITAKGSELYLNKKAAEMMGVIIPGEVVQDATKVYDEIKE